VFTMMRPRRTSAMVAGGLILLESLSNDRAREVSQFKRMLVWIRNAGVDERCSRGDSGPSTGSGQALGCPADRSSTAFIMEAQAT